jgi:hypothetical protein
MNEADPPGSSRPRDRGRDKASIDHTMRDHAHHVKSSTRATEKEASMRKHNVEEGEGIVHEKSNIRSPTETIVEESCEKVTPETARDQGESGVSWERRTRMDMGDGPEEVIIIDWAPNDPQVSLGACVLY